MSSSMTFPKPWHVGQAPNGLLNEKSLGCGVSYAMPHARHSKRSENTILSSAVGPRSPVGSEFFESRIPDPESRPIAIANAAPPPSRYDVSIESVSRLRRSPSTRTRSTTTSSVARLASAERSRSSNVTALPSTSKRPNPRRRSPLIVSPIPSTPFFAGSSSSESSSPFSSRGRRGRCRESTRPGISKPIRRRAPSGNSPRRLATISAVSRITSWPHCRQNVLPTRANRSRM